MGFNEYLGAIDSYVGDADFLGAATRHGRHPHHPHHRPLAHAAAATLAHAATGIPKPGPRIEPLGFTAVTFTAASGTTLVATAAPQKPFKGSRLVIASTRTATATGLVSITSLLVGVRQVLVSAQPIPVDAFAPNAFGVELMMDEAGPGIVITATFVISAAPVMAEVVNIGTTIMGLSWS